MTFFLFSFPKKIEKLYQVLKKRFCEKNNMISSFKVTFSRKICLIISSFKLTFLLEKSINEIRF